MTENKQATNADVAQFKIWELIQRGWVSVEFDAQPLKVWQELIRVIGEGNFVYLGRTLDPQGLCSGELLVSPEGARNVEVFMAQGGRLQ